MDVYFYGRNVYHLEFDTVNPGYQMLLTQLTHLIEPNLLLYFTTVFLLTELPWDEPTYGCQEYCDWKDCKITLSPWKKIDNLALCMFCFAFRCFFINVVYNSSF